MQGLNLGLLHWHADSLPSEKASVSPSPLLIPSSVSVQLLDSSVLTDSF